MSSNVVGQLVCINPACQVAGLATIRNRCAGCGDATHARNEPGLVVPTPRPQPASGPSKLEKGMEAGSRVVYGGFWAVVTVGLVIAGFALLSDGNPSGLLSLIIAALTGIYAVYIFRGGRWRIMFW
jgi:hypothetical protein